MLTVSPNDSREWDCVGFEKSRCLWTAATQSSAHFNQHSFTWVQSKSKVSLSLSSLSNILCVRLFKWSPCCSPCCWHCHAIISSMGVFIGAKELWWMWERCPIMSDASFRISNHFPIDHQGQQRENKKWFYQICASFTTIMERERKSKSECCGISFSVCSILVISREWRIIGIIE